MVLRNTPIPLTHSVNRTLSSWVEKHSPPIISSPPLHVSNIGSFAPNSIPESSLTRCIISSICWISLHPINPHMQLWEMNRKMMSQSRGSGAAADHKSIRRQHQLGVCGQSPSLDLQVGEISHGKDSEFSPYLWVSVPRSGRFQKTKEMFFKMKNKKTMVSLSV